MQLPLRWIVVAMACLVTAPAAADALADVKARSAAISDHVATRKLEEAVADLFAKNDMSGLKLLADRVKSEDGSATQAVWASLNRILAAWGSGDSGVEKLKAEDPVATHVIDMKECESAGYALRFFLSGVADGSIEAAYRSGTVTAPFVYEDSSFATHMDACEKANDITGVRRKVGFLPAEAIDPKVFQAKIQKYSDPKIAQRLEVLIFENALKDGALIETASKIRAEDWSIMADFLSSFEWFVGLGNRDPLAMLPSLSGDPDPRVVAIGTAGLCVYAAMYGKLLVTQLADGPLKPVLRNGRIMVDGSPIDTQFSNNLTRCEQIERAGQNPPIRKVGDLCQITGEACADDPDNPR